MFWKVLLSICWRKSITFASGITLKNTLDMMKRLVFLILASIFSLLAVAQLPQLLYNDYGGWIYANPAVELNQTNIVNGRIVLYHTSTGLDLTLTSPEFACPAGQTIDMNIVFIIDEWQNSDFVVSKVALTAALLDVNGVAVDSVTWAPSRVSRTNYVDLSIPVPKGLTVARLRFASWKADVDSSGAIRQIKTSARLRGDVNLDGEVTVADVNAVIDVILSGTDDDNLRKRADVNGDGEVGLADINSVIDVILV